jgi:hypothetical protein
MLDLHDIFQLPLTLEAFQQYFSLKEEIYDLNISQETDKWVYIWGSSQFSVHKTYIALTGHMPTHHVFNKLWSCKCQPKHRVFFWLLMHDKLNTRGRLQQRHMALDSYVCENCILQRLETSYHLFLRCSFATMCWTSIAIIPPIVSEPKRAVTPMTKQLRHQCAMEIIIHMSWTIWKCRNGWIFEGIPPMVNRFRNLLKEELKAMLFRLQPDRSESLTQWINSVHL